MENDFNKNEQFLRKWTFLDTEQFCKWTFFQEMDIFLSLCNFFSKKWIYFDIEHCFQKMDFFGHLIIFQKMDSISKNGLFALGQL